MFLSSAVVWYPSGRLFPKLMAIIKLLGLSSLKSVRVRTFAWSAAPVLLHLWSFIFEEEQRAVSRNELTVLCSITCASPNTKVQQVPLFSTMWATILQPLSTSSCSNAPQYIAILTYCILYKAWQKLHTCTYIQMLVQYQTVVVKITCLATLGNVVCLQHSVHSY